jgi:hypothetical protein
MSLGIECLLSESLDAAMTLALRLDELNRERLFLMVVKLALRKSHQHGLHL